MFHSLGFQVRFCLNRGLLCFSKVWKPVVQWRECQDQDKQESLGCHWQNTTQTISGVKERLFSNGFQGSWQAHDSQGRDTAEPQENVSRPDCNASRALSLPKSLPASVCTPCPHGSLCPQDGDHGCQPARVFTSYCGAISQSQLESSQGKTERPSLILGPLSISQLRPGVGSKNMMPWRPLALGWKWGRKHT